MIKSSNTCQNFRIPAKTLKLLGVTLHFMNCLEKLFLFGWACQILGRDRPKIRAKKEKCVIFPGLSKGIRRNSP